MLYTISDLSLASFILMRGVRLILAEKKGNKFEFTFESEKNIVESLEQEYIVSDFSKYDAAIRQLKRKLYGPRFQS